MELLRFALTGCRDAAYHNKLNRCNHEHAFSNAIRNGITSHNVERALQQAFDAFAIVVSKSDDDVLECRLELYQPLLNDAVSRAKLLAPNWTDVKFVSFVSSLDVGLKFLGKALLREDLLRAEIEADHIHNLPMHIVPDSQKSVKLYLKNEVSYYLDRIRENCGQKIVDEVSQCYEIHWKAMKKITEMTP